MNIQNFYGREYGVNEDQIILKDCGPIKYDDIHIFGGSPMVKYLVSGDTVPSFVSYHWLHENSIALNKKPWGCALFNYNHFRKEIYDMLGYAGGHVGDVAMKGIITLCANSFVVDDIGTIVKVFPFVETETFVVNAPCFANVTVTSGGLLTDSFGKITQVKEDGVNDNTLSGYVSAFYASATDPVLELSLV